MHEILIFMHENEISMHVNEDFMHENEKFAPTFSWVNISCMKLCKAPIPINIYGRENHAKAEIVIFMHENMKLHA